MTLREYLVVATRPVHVNGLGLPVADASANIAGFRQRCVVVPETEEVCKLLLDLVQKHNVVGKRIHDANMAATATAHGIEVLLTENAADFADFHQLHVLSLSDLRAGR